MQIITTIHHSLLPLVQRPRPAAAAVLAAVSSAWLPRCRQRGSVIPCVNRRCAGAALRHRGGRQRRQRRALLCRKRVLSGNGFVETAHIRPALCCECPRWLNIRRQRYFSRPPTSVRPDLCSHQGPEARAFIGTSINKTFVHLGPREYGTMTMRETLDTKKVFE